MGIIHLIMPSIGLLQSLCFGPKNKNKTWKGTFNVSVRTTLYPNSSGDFNARK